MNTSMGAGLQVSICASRDESDSEGRNANARERVLCILLLLELLEQEKCVVCYKREQRSYSTFSFL